MLWKESALRFTSILAHIWGAKNSKMQQYLGINAFCTVQQSFVLMYEYTGWRCSFPPPANHHNVACSSPGIELRSSTSERLPSESMFEALVSWFFIFVFLLLQLVHASFITSHYLLVFWVPFVQKASFLEEWLKGLCSSVKDISGPTESENLSAGNQKKEIISKSLLSLIEVFESMNHHATAQKFKVLLQSVQQWFPKTVTTHTYMVDLNPAYHLEFLVEEFGCSWIVQIERWQIDTHTQARLSRLSFWSLSPLEITVSFCWLFHPFCLSPVKAHMRVVDLSMKFVRIQTEHLGMKK